MIFVALAATTQASKLAFLRSTTRPQDGECARRFEASTESERNSEKEYSPDSFDGSLLFLRARCLRR